MKEWTEEYNYWGEKKSLWRLCKDSLVRPKCNFLSLTPNSTHPQNIIITVKHGGGSIVSLGCFTSVGIEELFRLQGNIDGTK